MATEIRVIPCEELVWAMGSERPNLPCRYATCGMDPFPAYPHDLAYVRERAELTIKAFPVPFEVDFWVPSFEAVDRFNGCCWVEDQWSSDEFPEKTCKVTGYKVRHPKRGHIVLSGKRIPPMRIMTEYLVAHEYGHAVEDYLAYCLSMTDTALKEEYARLRQLPVDKDGKGYVGRNWHKSTGEIFANDFRLLMTGAAPDFWPHECERPDMNYAIVGFWEKAKEFMYKPTPVNEMKHIDTFETPALATV